MKKVNFFAMLAAAALTLGVTSCSKDGDGKNPADGTKTQLSIKLSGVIQSAPGSRAVEAPGKTTVGTIQLNGGHIFVIDALGAVSHSEALNVSQATGALGQVLTAQVASDSRVYIIGNIPTSNASTIAGLTSFSAIQAATSALTTQTDYAEAALANSDGAPASITLGANNTATVTVSIKPLISRIELMQVKGASTITAFDVTAVYVDDYYPSFTYGGNYSGTILSQGQDKTTFNIPGNTGTWSATDAVTTGTFIANPGNGDVWAYQVASGSLPRFIIELDNIEYEDGNGDPQTLTGKHYLTVKSYTGLGTGVTTFERGKIYRIGAANGITFDEEDITITPNQEDVDLTVFVEIEEWVLVTPEAEL